MTSPRPTAPSGGNVGFLTPSPWLRAMLWQLVKLLAVGHVLVFVFFAGKQLARTDQERDLIIFYHTAQHARAGESLYISRPNYGPDQKPFDYLYPPPFAAALALGGNLSWDVWSRGWLALLIICWWVYAVCLVSLSGFALRPLNVCLAGLALFLTPGNGAYRAIGLGQADPLLWVAFGLALVGLQSERRAGRLGAGLLLGGATLVKIYSLWTFFTPRERETRVQMALGATLALLCGGALGVLVCGVGSYLTWARLVLPVAGQGTFNADNWSVSMSVLRLASHLGWHYGGGPLPSAAKVWLSAAEFIGPVAALWATRGWNEAGRVALVGAVAAWCAPLCWTTYIPLVLAPLALWGRHKLKVNNDHFASVTTI